MKDAPREPLDMPLPCDVKVGHTTFRKGVTLGTLIEAARRWHREAFPESYTLTDQQKAANLALLQGIGAKATAPDHCDECGGQGEFESALHCEKCDACNGTGKRNSGATHD